MNPAHYIVAEAISIYVHGVRYHYLGERDQAYAMRQADHVLNNIDPLNPEKTLNDVVRSMGGWGEEVNAKGTEEWEWDQSKARVGLRALYGMKEPMYDSAEYLRVGDVIQSIRHGMDVFEVKEFFYDELDRVIVRFGGWANPAVFSEKINGKRRVLWRKL